MKRRLYSLFAVLALLSATLVISAAPSGSAPLASSDRLTLGTDGSAPAHPSDPAVVRARLDARDRLAGVVNRNAARAAASNGDRAAAGRAQVPATDVGETNLTQRNFRNTVAQTRSSTLAEPAAAKDAAEALYMGNGNSTNGVYISRSANNGSTWTAETVPAGPTFAPNVCCDTDAVHHASLDTTFATILYLNASGTDGAIKIFVRRGSIAGGNDCTYTFDPGGTTTVPDYPHIGVSNSFVYLTLNRLNTQGTSSTSDDTWLGSSVVRFNASQMANCAASPASTTFTKSTGGQRVFTPVENATTVMFWGALDSSTSFRIFRWPESAAAPTQFVRSGLGTSNFTNSDCRGGTGNFDWIEKGTAFSIAGFRLRGAVGGSNLLFLWNVGKDTTHTQAHIHAAAFRLSDLALIAQPNVFSNSTCVGFPVVSGNSQGDFALSEAAGGRAGGLGTGTACSSDATCSARGYISIDDEDTAGIFFAVRSLTANGTHNRSDGRFGDYFTVRKADDCPLAWVATNYSLLNGNTSSSNVNARYAEIRSSRDPACP